MDQTSIQRPEDDHIAVPQEIIDAILEEIQDQETLKKCAYVSRLFRAPVQKRLFRSIHLGVKLRENIYHYFPSHCLEKLKEILASDPSIGLLVRSLVLDFPMKGWKGDDRTLESLRDVLGHFGQLQSLVFRGDFATSIGYFTATANLIRRSSLSKLTIRGLPLFPDAIPVLKYCRALSLNPSLIVNYDLVSGSIYAGPKEDDPGNIELSMEALDFYVPASWEDNSLLKVLGDPRSRIQLPHLQNLSISGIQSQEHMRQCSEMMKLQGKSIRKLQLNLRSEYHPIILSTEMIIVLQ
jgi:hypothetical protein